jgi:hypothetical protein
VTGVLSLAAALLTVSASAMTLALAAGTAVTAKRLTVDTGATSVPLERCTLSPVADSDVDTGLNTGTATTLRVRSSALGNRRALIRFDLAGCGLDADDAIRAASLSLVLGTAPASGRAHKVWRVTAAWTETGVSSLNEPAVAATETATQDTGTTAGATLTWNVLADVRAFHGGTPNHGWRVSDATEGAATAVEAVYRSREFATAAERPKLTIDYYP